MGNTHSDPVLGFASVLQPRIFASDFCLALVLEYFLAYSKTNRFNIISSICNSNKEYQSFRQQGSLAKG